MEFVDIDLPCNKLNVKLLANNSITCKIKKRILKTENEVDELFKVKATQEKKLPIKWIGKKNFKILVLILSLVDKSPPNIQALFINTNIVILALYFFQISLKFWEQT